MAGIAFTTGGVTTLPKLYARAHNWGAVGYDSGLHDGQKLGDYIYTAIKRENPGLAESWYAAATDWALYVIQAQHPNTSIGHWFSGTTIGGTITEGGKIIAKPVLSIADLIERLLDVYIWIRIAEVAGGIGLAYVAIRMLARESGNPLPKLPIPRG